MDHAQSTLAVVEIAKGVEFCHLFRNHSGFWTRQRERQEIFLKYLSRYDNRWPRLLLTVPIICIACDSYFFIFYINDIVISSIKKRYPWIVIVECDTMVLDRHHLPEADPGNQAIKP